MASASLALSASLLTLLAAPGTGHAAPASGGPGAPGAGDPYFPLAGNGGYDALHYSLTLGYVPGTRKLTGTAEISARATRDLTRFDLDLSGLTVRDVVVNGRKAAFGRSGQELVITPARRLPFGTAFRVTVRYAGKPQQVTDPDGSPDGWITTDDGAFVAGEPQGAMTWFPADNHPVDKAAYDFEITVPKGYTAVANGTLAGQRTTNGRTTFRWHSPEPMAAYLATATIGKFKVKQYRTASGLPVYNAVDPREATLAAPALAKIPEIVSWETKLFGRYPFSAVGAIVDHAPDVGYALETQSRPVYDRAPDTSTVVHELAHQWFGDSVSLTKWQDIWLNEGFATYAEWLYAEQHGGPGAQSAFEDLYAEPATAGLWDFPVADPGGGENIFASPVYDRGAMVLHKVRRAVGDQRFLRLLKTWASSRAYGHGTTAQFTALAERISGKDLDGLFETWLYTAGKPARP